MPTLRRLEAVRWGDIQRRRDQGVNRAAYLAENALTTALGTLREGPRNIEAIISTYANLSPVDVKGRDAVKYFIADVEIARRLPGAARRALLELHEHLTNLDRALALAVQEPKETCSIPLDPETRGPELPKTADEVPDETQTHAKVA